MSSEKNIQNVADITPTAGAENPPALVKKIGRTTYACNLKLYNLGLKQELVLYTMSVLR